MSNSWDDFDKPDFIEGLRKHDNEAWKQVNEKAPELRRVVRKAGVRDPALIDDCVNGGLARAADKIDKYNEELGSFRVWLVTVIYNEAVNENKRESRQRGGTISDTIDQGLGKNEPSVDPDFVHEVEFREVFDSLKPLDKQRISDVADGRTDKEIATRDGISTDAARQQCSRAKSKHIRLAQTSSF